MGRHRYLIALVVGFVLVVAGCSDNGSGDTDATVDPPSDGSPDAMDGSVLPESVIARMWAVDDGEKVRKYDLQHPLATSPLNGVWQNGRVELFGARNEFVAFQLILEGGEVGAQAVTVRLDSLDQVGGDYSINNNQAVDMADPFNYVGKRIELFTEHYQHITERTDKLVVSAWGYSGVQGDYLGWVPDALIPFAAPPGLGGVPFAVDASANQGVWIDVYIPKDAPPGQYTGEVVVEVDQVGEQAVPVVLQVFNITLPDETHLRNMFYFEPYVSADFLERYGLSYLDGAEYFAIEGRYYHLARRHRMDLIHNVSLNLMDTHYRQYVVDGAQSWYSGQSGYEGPGEELGNRTYSLGTYTSWRAGFPIDPTDPDYSEAAWQAQADAWVTWFSANAPHVEYFLYMRDEPPPTYYSTLIQQAEWIHSNPGVGGSLLVYCTIIGFPLAADGVSVEPTLVDALDYWAVANLAGIYHPPGSYWGGAYGMIGGYDTEMVEDRHLDGDKVALYNGTYPHYGITAIDADAVHQRVNPWIAWKYNVDQYFLYHTHLYQQQDPFVDNYRYVNTSDGQKIYNGLGTYLYPGTDLSYPASSRGLPGPIASIRMKNWRRGQQDYEYLWLARQAGLDSAITAIIDQVVPAALDDIPYNSPAGWPDNVNPPAPWANRGYAYEACRRELAELLDAE